MAIDFEDAFFKNYMGTMYPMEQEMAPDTQVASANTGVTTDVGGIAEIPRNKAQEALGYVGQLLTKAGVKLDDYGIDIPALGRVTLKDLTVGESGRILEDMSYGFMPVTGGGLATKLNPEVIDLLGLPFAGTAAKAVAKPVIKATEKIAKALPKDLPVGMSIKPVDESLDPLGFYSAASKAVDNIQQPKGTGSQFLAQIEKTPGVKKEELLWTGLDEFLAGKKSVTKAEVQDYLNTNRVEVKEVTLNQGARPYRYVTADEWQGAIYDAERVRNYDEAERITAAWENFELGGGSNKTKFAKYTLPGGENYREVLLTMPGNMSEYNKFSAALKAKYGDGGFDNLPLTEIERARLNKFYSNEDVREFKSQHFDQPNVLAHMRLNDRVDVDGKKVLFVEEVQSDWHQAGRKKGYAQDVSKQLDQINEERALLVAEKSKVLDEAKPFTDQGMDAPSDLTDRFTKADDRLTALQNMQNKLGQGVPDAPFKTSWHELSMKRAIQLAAEGGYDRIAFTTGKTQADRYDLSKQISRVTYKDEILRAYDKDGVEVISNLATPDKLEDYVGKELASKIIADNDKLRIANKNYRDAIKNDVPDAELNNLSREVGSFPMEYKGVDLQVGGEGMKGFYDTILPKYLDKYGKKWDAKVGMSEIPTDGTSASVHYMDITPKMKESVLTKGQPLFQAAPVIPAGAAASQQEENK